MIEKIMLRAPRELKEKLQELSKARGITLNATILQILWHWFEQQKE